MTTLNGQCHCGNLSYQIETDLTLQQIEARACDCSFCRIHAAQNWSDPAAQAVINIRTERLLNRYVFGLKTAEFFICRQCGAYAGAVLTQARQSWATLNLRLTQLPGVNERSMSFEGENVADRVARRKRVWMPVSIRHAAEGSE